MSRAVSRFTPSRRYLSMALFAVAGTLFSIWTALHLGPAWLVGASNNHALNLNTGWMAAVLFAIPAVILLGLSFRPAIEIHETHLRVGKQEIPWNRIRLLDQTGWNVPLAVYLTFHDEKRMLLIYPGDFESSASLLRHLRRNARYALLDGIPYGKFWGEPLPYDVTPLNRAVLDAAAVEESSPVAPPSSEPSPSTPPVPPAAGASSPAAGQPAAPKSKRQVAPPRYPLLSAADEEEVERMFQRLKTVGHLERRDQDPK